MKVYLAGPLFTPAERAALEEIAAICAELGFTTYLPHRDGGLLRQDRQNLQEVFAQDLQALREAAVVVAVLTGPDIDSGTAWEIGYAHCADKHIIAICQDFRIRDVAHLNPMIAGSALVTSNHAELRQALRALF